ncbi:pyruvate kinase, partial [Patescibacteria group bacterium]|nr:pyruvate kinase [Patescibacteria group bacterium]
ELYKYVAAGQKILLADGLMDVRVVEVRKKIIKVKVINGGVVLSHKGINIPESKEVIASLTDKDVRDLEFGIRNGVDYVALSFVQTADDVKVLRRMIKKFSKKYGADHMPPTKIITKIEKRQAIDNFDEILEETDGVMVARGDLGIETPLQDVPLLQKQIIEQCLEAAKPVITATQMLDSMTVNPRPTRAEVSDVANAVIDHTDAVMLSNETAAGKHPVDTVKTMRQIIEDTEESPYDDLVLENLAREDLPIDIAISNVSVRLAKNVRAQGILVATISGYTARVVSRYRPELPIIVTAESDKVKRQLALSWGVVPLILAPCRSVDELINKAVQKAKNNKLVKKNQRLIIIGGQPVGRTGNVNLIKVHQVI